VACALLVIYHPGGAAIAARPGALLEVATIGIGAAAVWAVVVAAPRPLWLIALCTFAFGISLTTSWPGRTWALAVDSLPAWLAAFLAAASLGAAAVVVVAGRGPARGRAPALLKAAAVCLVAGVVISTILAGPATTLAPAVLSFGVPVALAAVVVRRAPMPGESWLVLTALLAGAAVPSVIGIAAYVLEFGLPLNPGDLVSGKEALARPSLFQRVTFGNVGHFAALCVLLLPVAVTGAVRARATRLERAIACAAAVLLLAVLLLTLSRLALIAAFGTFLLLAYALATVRTRAAAAPLACAIAIALLFISPSMRGLFGGVAAPEPTQAAPALPAPASPAAGDASAAVRENALRTGLRVFADHAPFGVGSGRYPIYDPVNTAAHSLPVEVLAEHGVLAFAGLLLLILFVGVEIFRVLVARPPKPEDAVELRVACLLGAGSFLALGVVGGTALVVAQADVWAVALALLVALAATQGRQRADAG
jgi:hypothetical protein